MRKLSKAKYQYYDEYHNIRRYYREDDFRDIGATSIARMREFAVAEFHLKLKTKN
jgi:hypothetical protein